MDIWIKRFLLYLRSQRNFSRHTIRAYSRDLDEFLGFCSRQKIQQIDKLDRLLVRAHIAELQSGRDAGSRRRISRNTLLRKISSLRSFAAYLIRENAIKSDPFLLLTIPRKESRLPNFLSEGEVRELINSAGAKHGAGGKSEQLNVRNSAFLELMYSSGLRRSEISLLNVGDVDFLSGFVRVFGKGARERLTPVGEKALECINLYLQTRKAKASAGSPLFLNSKQGRLSPSGVAFIVKKAAKNARFARPVSPHLLRHSFATHMLDRGCDLRSVQEMLGHKSLASTQVYTHVSLEHLRRVYDKTHPRGKAEG